MAHPDPPFGDRSRQPHHHGRRPSVAGSSFTESVASSSVESDLSDRDFIPPQSTTLGVQPTAADAGAVDEAEDDFANDGPTETHSEPITPSLPPLGAVVSATTPSSSAAAVAAATVAGASSSRRPARPSIAAVPQHASTGDLASIDGLASSSGSHHYHRSSGQSNDGGDGISSSGPRPTLAVRAKSTPRLKSSSPYETPAPKPLRPPPRPLDELGSAGISFGRVLGHVYKEGTVRSIARRSPPHQQQQQPAPPPPPPQVKEPPPSSPPAATSTAANGRSTGANGPSLPRPTVVASISSASPEGIRSSEASARNSLSSSGGHGHYLGFGGRGSNGHGGGPSIRVLEPTPANTTPSSPAPRAHATLWGTDEGSDTLSSSSALDGFSFTQSYGTSQGTPVFALGRVGHCRTCPLTSFRPLDTQSALRDLGWAR